MDVLFAAVSPLWTLFNNLYIADFFDVAIIAVFIYSALFLFKQTRSFLILIGILIVVSLYAVSQIFNLYLTSLVLQSFFSVFLLVLVIVFQEELRRFFEFIAAIGTRQARSTLLTSGSSEMQEILQAIAYLAHQNIGALLVFRGRENIDRHIEGGRMLDGIISEDVIVSMFDTTSPGHDGAMIIYKDRIVEFGAHLPLSNNFKQIGKHGTRHSAALGISEVSDAFAIVVSEEQGTISVAENGKLTVLKNVEELAERLTAFLKIQSSSHGYNALESLIKKNSLEKILALFIAVIFWFSLAFRADTVQRSFALPISYQNLPETFIIEESSPKEIVVTFEGRGKSAFDRLDTKSLRVVIDASTIKSGENSVAVTEDNISHPFNFAVVTISPQTIEVTTQEYQLITLPIDIKSTGKPRTGYRLSSVNSSPASIQLYAPIGTHLPPAISTETISIDGIRENTTLPVKLIVPPEFRLRQLSDSEVLATFILARQ